MMFIMVFQMTKLQNGFFKPSFVLEYGG